jgi:hypothetical protein
MAEIISCPNCQRKLQVPQQYLGQKVQCPDCRHMFTAGTAASAEAPPASTPSAPPAPKSDDRRRRDDYDDEDDRPARRGRYDDDDDDREYDDVRRRRHRGDFVPHRGGLILAMGLIGLVGFLACVFPVVLGPIAWIMGNSDLREMRAGRMDPAGEGMTRGGQICGMIATLFMIVGGLIVCLMIAADIRR